MIISRREYKADDCFVHLESKVRCQQAEISQLIEEMRSVRQIAENEKIDLREEISKLNDNVTQQREEITKLNASTNGIPLEVAQFDKIRFSSILSPDWQMCDNIKFETDDQSILQCDDQSNYGLVQLTRHINAAFRFFEINILKCGGNGTLVMGLTSRWHSPSIRCGNSFNCFSYRSSGEVTFGYKRETTEEILKEGDVIRCGIKFPTKTLAIDTNHTNKQIYFTKNGKEIMKWQTILFSNPLNIRLYPTVYIEGIQYDADADEK